MQQSAFRERDTGAGLNIESPRNTASDKLKSQSAAIERRPSEIVRGAVDKLNIQLPTNAGSDCGNKNRFTTDESNNYMPPEKRMRTDSAGN